MVWSFLSSLSDVKQAPFRAYYKSVYFGRTENDRMCGMLHQPSSEGKFIVYCEQVKDFPKQRDSFSYHE